MSCAGDEPDTAYFQLSPRDAVLGVNAIATGEEMTFKLQDLKLSLPNDRKFKHLYAALYEEVDRLPRGNH
jgi:hypothetical protein